MKTWLKRSIILGIIVAIIFIWINFFNSMPRPSQGVFLGLTLFVIFLGVLPALVIYIIIKKTNKKTKDNVADPNLLIDQKTNKKQHPIKNNLFWKILKFILKIFGALFLLLILLVIINEVMGYELNPWIFIITTMLCFIIVFGFGRFLKYLKNTCKNVMPKDSRRRGTMNKIIKAILGLVLSFLLSLISSLLSTILMFPLAILFTFGGLAAMSSGGERIFANITLVVYVVLFNVGNTLIYRYVKDENLKRGVLIGYVFNLYILYKLVKIFI